MVNIFKYYILRSQVTLSNLNEALMMLLCANLHRISHDTYEYNNESVFLANLQATPNFALIFSYNVLYFEISIVIVLYVYYLSWRYEITAARKIMYYVNVKIRRVRFDSLLRIFLKSVVIK